MSATNDQCLKIEPMLDAYLDGELTSDEREKVSAHLSSCEGCTSRLSMIKQLVNSLQKMPKAELSRDLSADIEKLLEKDLASAKVSLLRPLWLGAIAAAAAAVLLVVAFRITGGSLIGTVASRKSEQGESRMGTTRGSQHLSDQQQPIVASDAVSNTQDLPPSIARKAIGGSARLSRPDMGQRLAVSPEARSTTGGIAEQIRVGDARHRAVNIPGMKPGVAGGTPVSRIASSKTERIDYGQQGTAGSDYSNGDGDRILQIEVALLADGDAATGALGLDTDEDGLYAIKM